MKQYMLVTQFTVVDYVFVSFTLVLMLAGSGIKCYEQS